MLYIINYDVDDEPTVRHAYTSTINAVPWEEIQLELQQHYMRYGSPLDVLYWQQVVPDNYFRLE